MVLSCPVMPTEAGLAFPKKVSAMSASSSVNTVLDIVEAKLGTVTDAISDFLAVSFVVALSLILSIR